EIAVQGRDRPRGADPILALAQLLPPNQPERAVSGERRDLPTQIDVRHVAVEGAHVLEEISERLGPLREGAGHVLADRDGNRAVRAAEPLEGPALVGRPSLDDAGEDDGRARAPRVRLEPLGWRG